MSRRAAAAPLRDPLIGVKDDPLHSVVSGTIVDLSFVARDFARIRLVIAQGVLKGRYSGYVVEDFLRGHGRLNEARGRADGGNAEVAVGDARTVEY